MLRSGENATSDVFHFSVEDNGKISPSFGFAFIRLSVLLLFALSFYNSCPAKKKEESHYLTIQYFRIEMDLQVSCQAFLF